MFVFQKRVIIYTVNLYWYFFLSLLNKQTQALRMANCMYYEDRGVQHGRT